MSTSFRFNLQVSDDSVPGRADTGTVTGYKYYLRLRRSWSRRASSAVRRARTRRRWSSPSCQIKPRGLSALTIKSHEYAETEPKRPQLETLLHTHSEPSNACVRLPPTTLPVSYLCDADPIHSEWSGRHRVHWHPLYVEFIRDPPSKLTRSSHASASECR